MPSLFDPALDQLREMVRGLGGAIPRIAIALVMFLLIAMLSKGVGSFLGRATRKLREHRNLSRLFARVAQTLIVLSGALFAVAIIFPSFKIGNIVQLFGIGSVAVGFAFRDILQNFLAGILLLWTEPFRIGDQIRYADFEGTVEDIQTRATFIRTYDGRRVVIPNAELFTNPVTVNTAFEQRRVEYDVGIGLSDDIELAKETVLEALRSIPDVLREPAPDVLVVELADFAVKLRVRWWINPPNRNDVLNARDLVLAKVKARLLETGIDLPYPTTQVLFHDQTEEVDGDRRKQREGWPAGRGQETPAPARDSRSVRLHSRAERAR